MGPDDSGHNQLPVSPNPLIEPERWARLDSYFADKLPLAERIEMDRWAAEHEARRKLVAELRELWERAEKAAPQISAVDIRQVLNTLAEKRDAIDAAAAGARGPDLRLGETPGGASANRAESPWSFATPLSRTPRSLPHRTRSGRPVAMIAAIAAAIVLAVGLPRLASRSSAPTAASSVRPMREIVTKRAQQAALDLPDGSRVLLAAGSKLRIPADYDVRGANGVRRELYLEGKAHFEVEHDSTRPFIVHTATSMTEDIGTEFVVDAYREARATKVAVVSGIVALRRPRTGPSLVGDEERAETSKPPLALLDAGDVARLDRTGTAIVARNVPLDSYLSWTRGVLAFDGTPVREAVAELSRWFDVDVAVGSSAFDSLRVTGEFRDEPVDQVLEAVARSIDARVERRGSSIVFMPRSLQVNRLDSR